MSEREEKKAQFAAPAGKKSAVRGEAPGGQQSVWSVYMLRCRDDSLYTGITTDLDRRLAEHRGNDGRGARYLRGRGPVSVVLSGEVGGRGLALKVESRIKRLSRQDKEHLVAVPGNLRTLIRSIQPLGGRTHLR